MELAIWLSLVLEGLVVSDGNRPLGLQVELVIPDGGRPLSWVAAGFQGCRQNCCWGNGVQGGGMADLTTAGFAQRGWQGIGIGSRWVVSDTCRCLSLCLEVWTGRWSEKGIGQTLWLFRLQRTQQTIVWGLGTQKYF